MKALFVHGGDKLKVDTESNYYTGGSYNSRIWERYLRVFPEMTVMLRKEEKIFQKTFAERKFQYFDKEVLTYIEMPDINASISARVNPAKRKNIKQTIESEVQNSDCVIVRMPGAGGDIAIKAAKKYKKPYIIELVGCPWDSLWNHSIKGKLLAPSSYLTLRRLIKNAPYVVYVTNDFLQKRYPTLGNSIGCSDVELLSMPKDVLEKRLSRVNQSLEKERLILGTISPVDVRYKGQEYVIEALSRLNSQMDLHIEYHLVGDGDVAFLQSIAEKYGVKDQVKFFGSLPHNQVYEFLDNIDIYVQPSKTEGLARSVLEGMSRACPVIGTNVGGNPELINQDWLFSKGSSSEICALLSKVSKQKLVEESKRSFESIQYYDNVLLNEKREKFLIDFKNSFFKK